MKATKPHSSSSSTSPSSPPPRKRPRTTIKRTWLTKAARKRVAQTLQTNRSDHSDVSEDDPDHEEENIEDEEDLTEHFSSDDDQNPETDPEDTISRFFAAEDYQQLLTKCLSVLDLKEKQLQDQTGDNSTRPKRTHPNNTLWGSGDYFPKRKSSQKVFPFPIFFEEQLKNEWETPATRKCPPAVVKTWIPEKTQSVTHHARQ